MAIPEIIFENEHWIRFRPTERLLRAFRSFRISFGEKRAEQFGGPIEMAKLGVFESYSDFTGPRIIYGIGSFSYVMSGIGQFRLGRYCSIADGARELGERHPIEHVTTSSFCYRVTRPALLDGWNELLPEGTKAISPTIPTPAIPAFEHDVWVGQNAQIARGITLHTGCVVAAGAVVTKDVPPYAIVGGSPAKIIKRRFSEKIIERLLASKWWELHPRHIVHEDLKDPERFLDRIAGVTERWEPTAITWRNIVAQLELQPAA